MGRANPESFFSFFFQPTDCKTCHIRIVVLQSMIAQRHSLQRENSANLFQEAGYFHAGVART